MTVTDKSAYYIRTSFSVQRHVRQLSLCLIDTGAQLKLTTRRYMPNHWFRSIENKSLTKFTSATKDHILTLRQPELHVTIGDSQGKTQFFFAGTLSVGIPLEVKFINQHILRIRRDALKVLRGSLLLIAIVYSRLNTVQSTIATDDFDTIQVRARDADVKVAKQILLKKRSVILVTVVATARDNLRIDPKGFSSTPITACKRN